MLYYIYYNNGEIPKLIFSWNFIFFISSNFKFIYLIGFYQEKIYLMPLYAAVDKENIEIVKLLLSNDQIDVNAKSLYEI